MSITSLNFTEYADNAEKAFNNKEIKWKPAFAASFLDHTLPIFATVKLQYTNGKVSATDTFNSLLEHEMITTPNGEMFAPNILQLIRLLYFTKRGDYILGSQIRSSRLASFTPLFLYAHKLYNDVPYSSWDKEDPRMFVFLGTVLEEIIRKDFEVPNLSADQIVAHREAALTFKTGQKAGTMEKPYNYKCAINEINGLQLPRTAIMMILQLWLANSAVRNTSSMILDPLDWDNVPEAHDVTVDLPEVKVVAPKQDLGYRDITWT